VRISKYGQVTIPRELRRQLGFEPYTEVEFIPEGVALRLVRKQSGCSEKINLIYGLKSFGKSTDDLMKLLRQ